MDVVATGVPAWPEIGGGFDLSPLLMILAAFVVAPLLFRVRLTPIAAILLVAGGTLALAAGASIARRRRPHRG